MLASLAAVGCKMTCDTSGNRCEGNDIVACECDGISCSTAVLETCEGDDVCREHERRAACVPPLGPCPPERREDGPYCEDNAVHSCFGEHLLDVSQCPRDSSCVEGEDGAECADWTPPCTWTSVRCESGGGFRFCILGSWGPWNECPEGTVCDESEWANPCVTPSDAGSSEPDGG